MKHLYQKCMNKSLNFTVVVIWLLGVIVAFIMLLQLIFSSRILNSLDKGYQQIFFLFSVISISFVLYIILNAIYERIIATKEMKLNCAMRKYFGYKINNMEFSLLENYDSGNIFSMITIDIENIGLWFQSLLRIGGIVFQLIAALVVSLILSWQVALVLFPVGILATIAPGFFFQKLYQYNLKEKETDNALNAELFESINFLATIKSYCLEDHFIRKNKELLEDNANVRKNIYKQTEKGIRADVIVGHLTLAVVLTVGAFLIMNNIVTLGDVYGIIFITGSIGTGINALIAMLPKFKSYKVSVERINNFFNENEFASDKIKIELKDNIENVYTFKNVTFSYNDKKQTLHNLNFKIKKDEKIAIVGQSGCGKTTLFKVMSGLYSLNDDNGIIELCNVNIAQMALKDIMNYVSIMSQDTYLFEGSIYNNINLFNDTITLEEVRNICKRLGLDDVIMTFSDGYETIVSRMQKKLSRGQIQRIGLARTLLQKKNIVLLDEPTSALDLELSKIVLKEIKSFSKDRTIILITHKLSQPQDFDRILVLKDGKVVGFDTDENLRKSCEVYNTLLKEGMTMA